MQQFANTERDLSQRVSAVHPISIEICWTFAVGALIAMAVAFGLGQIWQKFIGLGPSPASLIRYVPEVAHAFYPGELPDVRVQKRAYQIGLLAIFLPFLICAFGNDRIRGALFRRLTPFSLRVRRLKRSPVLFWCAMAIVYLIEVRRQGDTLISPLGLRSLLFAAALLLAIGLFIREFRKAAWYSSGIRMLAIASGAAILVAAVAGLFFPAEMRQWPYVSLTMVEAHFGFVTGAADRLGAGLRLFDDVRPYYGLFPEALVGAAIRLAGPFDWAAIYRCVQVCQLAMLLCICLALFFWRGTRRPLLWLVLPSALVLPDLFAAYHMNWFPNQTGWRFLGFGFALVTLCVAPRLSKLATLLLFAATASVALVWNPETGLVVVFGFIAYLATGYARPSFLGGMRKVGELGVAIFACLLLLAGGFRLAFGYWPVPTSSEALLTWYETFLSGFGSLPLQDIDLVALVIFVHCASILLRGVLTWIGRPLAPALRIRMAFATMALAWLSYYVNRPQTLNLWTILYLYTPLVVTAFDPRRLAYVWRSWVPRPTIALLPPVLVLAMAVNHQQVTNNLSSLMSRSGSGNGVEVSGVSLQKAAGERILARADFIRNLPDPKRTVIFSANSFLLPLLTGLYPSLPARDLFWETVRESDLQQLLDRLFELAPSTILFDAEESPVDLPYGGRDREAFYERIKATIANRYVRDETSAGWDVWRVKKASNTGNSSPIH